MTDDYNELDIKDTGVSDENEIYIGISMYVHSLYPFSNIFP